jgi:hypothetical protein
MGVVDGSDENTSGFDTMDSASLVAFFFVCWWLALLCHVS